MDLSGHWVGFASLGILVVAYLVVVGEEFSHLRKSKPVMLAAGLIWGIIAFQYAQAGDTHSVEEAVKEFLLEFAELFLFLLAAMTYVNSMSERRVFDALRSWLVRQRFGYRSLFWITGVLSFFLSAAFDNPTLMVWQRGVLDFLTFFNLFVPSVVNYLVPAVFMSLAVQRGLPAAGELRIPMKRGAIAILLLFAATIATAVSFHHFLHLPPFLGMMTGLAYLKIYGYYLRVTHDREVDYRRQLAEAEAGDIQPFDSFREVARAEWDTLLFFFGVIMCVGGLGFIGYLAHLSTFMYLELGPTLANGIVGVLSAVVDNIPVMVAVLQMQPQMDVQQWLLVTLAAGVGGSMLSIGSAAGVALMGQARGYYTFFGHLRWTPVIALGYVLSIWVHLLVNARFAGVMP